MYEDNFYKDDVIGRKITERNDRESVYLDDGSSCTIHRSVYIEEPITMGITSVVKSVEEKQMVSGWANISINANGEHPLDWEGDIIPPAVLEKAAINFMIKHRQSGVQHEGDSVGTVVESVMFTKEKMKAIGIPENTVPEGWFITVKVHDKEVFKKVKEGKYRMFSIQGVAKKLEV
jgi:hypothetical protein